MIKSIFLSGISIFLSLIAMSNHIGGGSFTVQYIDENYFEAKIQLFRDCDGNLVIDNVINISVYDAGTHAYLQSLSFTISDPVSETVPIGSPCNDLGICVDIQTYTTNFSLPDNAAGYYLSWERCCRNSLGVNVMTAESGMVFTVLVADPALQNSSPEFISYPDDAFLCVNAPKTLNFSATDADGDELVYSLADPLKGEATSPFNPTASISGPQPYSTIEWMSPYSLDNMVGGDIPMSIDSETGFITGQAETLGYYTIVVRVEEYRDGVKIGEIMREVQIGAFVCNEELFTYELNGMDVICVSCSPTAQEWSWDFGDGNSSTEQNPVHTYFESGTYEITHSTDEGFSQTQEVTVVDPLEVDNHYSDRAFSIFPIPANESIRITMNDNTSKPGSLKLLNSLGQVQKSVNLTANLYERNLDISDLSDGIYIAVLHDVKGNIIGIRKLLIAR